jgi:hypothetical protein
MERLFSPCTRWHGLLESRGIRPPERMQELNLDVSTEELLSAKRAFTYSDLYAMLGRNGTAAAWLSPHAAVARGDERAVYSWFRLDESRRFCLSADGNEIVALARSPEHLSEICDVVVRLLAASAVHSVILQKWNYHDDALINAPTTVAYLMEQCQSLKVLNLHDVGYLDEDHCRVLGAFSRPDPEIELIRCELTSAGASALAEVLGRNQGPTKLDQCDIDNSFLADGLRGNSCLKSLTPQSSSGVLEIGNREVLAISGALRENKGLVELHLTHCSMSDETWDEVCDSLETHPTLQVLSLQDSTHRYAEPPPLAPAVLKPRIQALADMMKMNMSIHTIHLYNSYRQHELFRESVIPYLETNRFRPRVRAIQKARPIPYRAKVLGRALQSARTDPNSFWMLLSGNPEVAFPSSTTANATFAFAPTVAADTNAATPSNGQKRKAHP